MKRAKMERILIIDDDVELCTLVSEYLQAEGFTVEAVHDGENGLQRAAGGGYLLVVLDVMLPGINGFEVLRRLRATSRLPVLLLTARGEDVDRIVGLEIGADDYLPKPFNPRELVARIRAEILLRDDWIAARISLHIRRGSTSHCRPRHARWARFYLDRYGAGGTSASVARRYPGPRWHRHHLGGVLCRACERRSC